MCIESTDAVFLVSISPILGLLSADSYRHPISVIYDCTTFKKYLSIIISCISSNLVARSDLNLTRCFVTRR